MIALVVMLGAALGAAARYALTLPSPLAPDPHSPYRPLVPWPTFVANILASFLLAIIIRTLGSSTELSSEVLFGLFGVGFCGALSTMSTFAFEVFHLVRHRALVSAVGYVMLSLGASLAAFWCGLVLIS